jgi:bacteriocin-like protein
MKTKEELNALKEEVETLSKKLAELTEEELEQVSGGLAPVLTLEPDREVPVPRFR